MIAGISAAVAATATALWSRRQRRLTAVSEAAVCQVFLGISTANETGVGAVQSHAKPDPYGSSPRTQ